LDDLERSLGKKIDFYAFEYNDPEVYKMISLGDTDAVFQLESGGYKRFMKDLRPDCIEDLIAAAALYRPGPMDMIPDYCRNKHNPNLTTYEHGMLKSILKETYGQIVYQEQVMDIFKIVGGFSLGQADMVRRAMGKKNPKEMEKQKDIFINGSKKMNIVGAVANGVPKAVAKSIFDKMEKFAGYAFNKSHSACYAYISYQTAYLKRHYYPYYMANVLNNRVHKWDDMTHYINSVRARGIQVLTPDINKSRAFFSVETTPSPPSAAPPLLKEGESSAIRFGLAAIKNVGAVLIESILQERSNNGAFKSFQDFCNRVDSTALNKRCLESLILGGAFDALGATRSSLMAVYPSIVKLISGQKKATDAGQMSMFGGLIESNDVAVEIPRLAEYDDFTKLKLEKEVVGIYLSGHPLINYAKLFEEFSFNTSKLVKMKDENGEIKDEEELENGKQVVFGAIVADHKKMLTKATKKEMAVLRVEDLYGAVEVMLFPAVFERVRNLTQKDTVVKISGKLSIREGEEPVILADNIELLVNTSDVGAAQNLGLASLPRNDTGGKRLFLKYNTKDEYLQGEVLNILGAYSGDIPVVVRCLATGEAVAPKNRVRDCKAVVIELQSLLGHDNVVLK